MTTFPHSISSADLGRSGLPDALIALFHHVTYASELEFVIHLQAKATIGVELRQQGERTIAIEVADTETGARWRPEAQLPLTVPSVFPHVGAIMSALLAAGEHLLVLYRARVFDRVLHPLLASWVDGGSVLPHVRQAVLDGTLTVVEGDAAITITILRPPQG